PQLSPPAPHAEVQTEARVQPEPAAAAAAAEEEPADDTAARRRSTVREKVSFMLTAQPEPATPVAQATEPVIPPAPVVEPAPEAANETPAAPRRAGWWSRRFGGGE
ncbi:ribonuclease E/G, partial [Bradyrhizobium cajani]|nr:ribonuclease E/G [Bradyrhizobium cajani]